MLWQSCACLVFRTHALSWCTLPDNTGGRVGFIHQLHLELPQSLLAFAFTPASSEASPTPTPHGGNTDGVVIPSHDSTSTVLAWTTATANCIHTRDCSTLGPLSACALAPRRECWRWIKGRWTYGGWGRFVHVPPWQPVPLHSCLLLLMAQPFLSNSSSVVLLR